MTSTLPARAALTLLLAVCAALFCVWIRLPLPWMIGPLLATATASVIGYPTRSLVPLRNCGQLLIGSAMGLYFTPAVMLMLAGLWWAIGMTVAWSLALGFAFAWALYRTQGTHIGGTPAQQRATCFFAGAVGGASEMTLLAEVNDGRADLVAASHSVRTLMVAIIVPFSITAADVHGTDASLPAARTVVWAGLVILLACAVAASFLMVWTRRTNPWFLGPLLVCMLLTMFGVELSAMPTFMLNMGQLLIGVSLGVRFSRQFVLTAPRWLTSVALGTLGLIVLCALFGVGVAWLAKMSWATLALGTAPGGIAEVAITAKVLQLGVPVVIAFQVIRLLSVLVLAGPIYRAFSARTKD